MDRLRIGCFQGPDLPHKRYQGSGMDALVTVCSSKITRVSGEGETNHEQTLNRAEIARQSARASPTIISLVISMQTRTDTCILLITVSTTWNYCVEGDGLGRAACAQATAALRTPERRQTGCTSPLSSTAAQRPSGDPTCPSLENPSHCQALATHRCAMARCKHHNTQSAKMLVHDC